jgi:UPF0755 protein
MKKIIQFLLLIIILFAGITIWLLLGSGTAFEEPKKYFIVEQGKNSKEVLQTLSQKYIIKNPIAFSIVANQLGVWNKLKPGKYEVKKGASILAIARMLKNNQQANINLVINKLRVKEDMAKLVSRNFAIDSISVMNFLTNNDSLKNYGVDTNTVFTIVIPDTYTFYWNTSIRKIFNKLYEASENYWQKDNRMQKAKLLHFTKEQAYILASIVEEETNKNDDRSKIASVYINRINKQMPLQACPTIKYAMNDFTLTRIYEKYLFNPSPYNTYRHKGLPPGPICTPSPTCVDIVLNAPTTDYLFFVAKSDFSGYHHFSNNFAEHNQYAKAYQKALDEYQIRKQQKEATKELLQP